MMALYSAAQAAVAGLERGVSVFVLQRKRSLAQRLYALINKNTSLFHLSAASGFWLILFPYSGSEKERLSKKGPGMTAFYRSMLDADEEKHAAAMAAKNAAKFGGADRPWASMPC
ncbi:MAG: hypothetical protein EOO03_18495, partial [Chitinophagaceae bacterium]